jgi:hypothetical protein
MPATEIRPVVPLRLIGLDSHSGYSTASRGVWPFGISTGVVDRVRTVEVRERHATRECLTMTEPSIGEQLISGVWPNDRWMSSSAVVLLKSPAAPAPLGITFYIPDNAKARSVWLMLDGREVTPSVSRGPAYTISNRKHRSHPLARPPWWKSASTRPSPPHPTSENWA